MKEFIKNCILNYLRICAKIQLFKIKPKIVGVGGSSGKTSLVNLIAIALSAKYRVKQSKGKNTESGIPLNILGITMNNYGLFDWLGAIFFSLVQLVINWDRYDVYIAEMAIDGPEEPRNMKYLLKIVNPDIAALTNISMEHSVYFDSLVKEEDKREEKLLALISNDELRLLTSPSSSKAAMVNLDDSEIYSARENIHARQITISLKNKKADFYAGNIKTSLNEFSMNIYHENKKYALKIHKLLPEHYAYSFLFTFAVIACLKIDINSVIEIVQKKFSLPPGRTSVFSGIKHTTIIDSSYNNATLPPILDMLDLFKKVSGKRRKVAIIGDMRELGSMSQINHEKVAKKMLATCDVVILIGPLMREYALPILQKNKLSVLSFLTFTEAKDEILKEIKENDVILVKSSQNTLFLERVVEMLLVNKDDVHLLCRRGAFWDKKRSETP